MTPDEILELIKSVGYWQVTVRPSVFIEDRGHSLGDLEEAVREARVMIRGWDYPHVPNDIERLGDHIQAADSWMAHHELWRLYKSGQFVHLFAMREDFWAEEAKHFGGSGPAPEPGTALSLLSTLYSVTEIVLFASRLSERLEFGPRVVLAYRLYQVGDRQLMLFDPRRSPLNETCRSSKQLFEYGKELELDPLELAATANEIAVDLVLDLYQQFNWEPARESVRDDQRKFFEKRF